MSKSIKDYDYKVLKGRINVNDIGVLCPCDNPTLKDKHTGISQPCGTCYGSWNYNHEMPYIKKLREILPQPCIGIDIGAHVGLYSIGLHKQVHTMYSFEPEKYGYEALCKNSGIYGNIVPIRLAVGDKSVGNENIEVVNLDSFMGGQVFPQFVKIDVEGQEIEVLKGMKNILRGSPEIAMLIELEMSHILKIGETVENFFGALKICGLNCDEFYNEVIKPNITDTFFTNLLIHKQGLDTPKVYCFHACANKKPVTLNKLNKGE